MTQNLNLCHQSQKSPPVGFSFGRWTRGAQRTARPVGRRPWPSRWRRGTIPRSYYPSPVACPARFDTPAGATRAPARRPRLHERNLGLTATPPPAPCPAGGSSALPLLRFRGRRRGCAARCLVRQRADHGLKTPVALLDKAQTNAAAKQAAAEVTAEQAKENPPSAVRSAAKAARTPGATSATRVLTLAPQRRDAGILEPRGEDPRDGQVRHGRESRGARRSRPSRPSTTARRTRTARSTPPRGRRRGPRLSPCRVKTPAVATPAKGAARRSLIRDRPRLPRAESSASKRSSQRARRSARRRREEGGAGTDRDGRRLARGGGHGAGGDGAGGSGRRRSRHLAARAEDVAEARRRRLRASASRRPRSRWTTTRRKGRRRRLRRRGNPRLTARAAAHPERVGAAKTPGRGPVAGAAAGKTPSRFAPTPRAPARGPSPSPRSPSPFRGARARLREPEPVSSRGVARASPAAAPCACSCPSSGSRSRPSRRRP